MKENMGFLRVKKAKFEKTSKNTSYNKKLPTIKLPTIKK